MKVTRTCCLDCSTRPCPAGYNCRDNRKPSWCVLGKDECLGDCDYFKRRSVKVKCDECQWGKDPDLVKHGCWECMPLTWKHFKAKGE